MISLFIVKIAAVYFDSLGIEINNYIIFRIQCNDSNVWIFMYCFHKIYDCKKTFIRFYQFVLS